MIANCENAFSTARTAATASGDGLLHRHHALHRLQGVRGRLQAVEPVPGDGLDASATATTTPGISSRTTWRHVAFIEQFDGGPRRRGPLADDERRVQALRPGAVPGGLPDRRDRPQRVRRRVVQQDICNGCGYCIAACPFGVIGRNRSTARPTSARSATTA